MTLDQAVPATLRHSLYIYQNSYLVCTVKNTVTVAVCKGSKGRYFINFVLNILFLA